MSNRRPALKVGDKVVHFLRPELYVRDKYVVVSGPYTIIKKDYMSSDRWIIRYDEGPRILDEPAPQNELYLYDEDFFSKYTVSLSRLLPQYIIPRADLNKLDLIAAMRAKHRNQELRRIWEEKTDTTSELGVGPLNKIKEFTGDIGVKPLSGPSQYMLNRMKRFEVVRTRKSRRQRKSRKQRKSRQHA